MRVGMGDATDGYDNPAEVPVTIDYGPGGIDGGGGGSFWDFLGGAIGSFGGGTFPGGTTVIQGADGRYYINQGGTLVPYQGTGVKPPTSGGLNTNTLLLFGGAIVLIMAMKK